jgi:transposase
MLTPRGVGPDNAAALLITAGDNPDRLRSEASFAACAASVPSRHPQAKSPATGSCRESPVVDLFRGSGLHVWARLVREGATGPALRVPAGVASCG